MDNLFAGMPSLLFHERGTAYPGYPASLGRRAGGRLPRNPGRLPSERWPPSSGMMAAFDRNGGRIPSESPAGFSSDRWSDLLGVGGRIGPEPSPNSKTHWERVSYGVSVDRRPHPERPTGPRFLQQEIALLLGVGKTTAHNWGSGRPHRTYGLPPARSGFLATTLPTPEPRSGPALTGSAKAHVEGGAIVVADGWQGYPCLSGMGYRPRPRNQRQLKHNEEIPPRMHRVFGNLKTWLRGTHHLRPVVWDGVNRIGMSGQSARQPRCSPSIAPQCPFPIPTVVMLPNATAG